MKIIADLHIHSRHSMSTSKDISLENMCKWAQLKGVNIIGTGDFTHPQWFQEIRDKLIDNENGLFSLPEILYPLDIPDKCKRKVFFILTTEINCIFRRSDRTRRIHTIILMPSLDSLIRFNKKISDYGNMSSDGRLTVRLDVKSLLEMIINIDVDAMLIPAHIWTPHYSIFGSKNGFDCIEDCFEELTPYITTLETGLSSDIAMNRQIKALDRINLVSFSDAHSPSNIAREATIFDTELSYSSILNALKTGQGLINTIEIFPQAGKYYLDGHRLCDVSVKPEEAKKDNYKCPVCKKPITIGVLNRINSLADRKYNEFTGTAIHTVPLFEILSFVQNKGIKTMAVQEKYEQMLRILGNELYILISCPIDKLYTFDNEIASVIHQVREGNVFITPGYDGKYGKIGFKPKKDNPF